MNNEKIYGSMKRKFVILSGYCMPEGEQMDKYPYGVIQVELCINKDGIYQGVFVN